MNEVQGDNSYSQQSLGSPSHGKEGQSSDPNNFQRPKEQTYQSKPKHKGPCCYCGLNGYCKSKCRKYKRDQNKRHSPVKEPSFPTDQGNRDLNLV
jgi:hypothetical protein